MAAPKVGVSEDEYNTMCAKLLNAQKDFIDRIETIEKSVAALNRRGGGFYAKDVTPNVTKLLSSISRIKATIEQMQSSENQIIGSFVRSIENIDSCS